MALQAGLQAAESREDLGLLQQRALQAAVDRVAPSVVRIQTVGGLERVGGVAFGAGPTTGLVVGGEGYIVSSALALANRPTSILVELADGSRKPAKLVATDHSRMVVLLKIEVEEPLPVPEIVGESDVRVGQWAIGLGRTFEGARPNVSMGIVSALNRVWGKAIQTDAAVSPNNYGGPLIDVRGRVLGVLVPLSPQAATDVAGVEWYDSGIGFAVPAWHLWRILPKLKRGEDLHPGLIGISFSDGSLSTAEAVIAARHPNSPAAEAGLQPEDRIVEIEGRKIVRASQVKEELSRRYAGDKVRMVILRKDERLDRELELVAKLEPYEHPFLGVLPMRTGASGEQAPPGVTVRYVYPEGPAASAGIEQGDVLVALGGEPIQDAEGLRRRISEQRPEDEVDLEVRRGENTLRLTVRLDRLPEDLPGDELPPARSVVQGEGPANGATAPGPNQAQPPQTGSIELKIPEFENDAWAYVPEDYDPAIGCGLIAYLPPPGPFDWDEFMARWKPHCDERGLILVAVKSAQPGAWQTQELTLVRKLLDEVKSNYAVDPTRIVVHGHTGGGRLAYLVAFANRDLVRAVAAVDAPVVARPPDNDPLYRLAFYLAWAGKSPDAEPIREAADRLREMKYPVSVKDLGQEPRHLNAVERAELVRWIDTLDRI